MSHFVAGPIDDILKSGVVPLVLAAPILLALLYILVPHFTTYAKLRKYPGPTVAGFTRLWLAKQTRIGKRSEIVHKEHQKYGPSPLFLLLRPGSRL